MSDNAGWIVECFFIISGYFLFRSLNNNKDFFTFIVKKVFRLAPVLIFFNLISVIFSHQDKITAIFNILFLQCIGLSIDFKGINWYISPLFWSLIFYSYLLKFFNRKIYLLIIVIIYLPYLINISYTNGSFGRETVFGVINLGFCRGLAGIGLGIIIAKGLDLLKNKHLSINKNIQLILLFSLIELFCTSFLIKYFLFSFKYNNNFIVVIIFSLLFICFIYKKGIISFLLDRKLFSLLGRYAYSIYVMQQFCFWILQRSLWKTDIVQSPFICLSLSLFFCIIIGIITYHVIEKPCNSLYLKIFK